MVSNTLRYPVSIQVGVVLSKNIGERSVLTTVVTLVLLVSTLVLYLVEKSCIGDYH